MQHETAMAAPRLFFFSIFSGAQSMTASISRKKAAHWNIRTEKEISIRP